MTITAALLALATFLAGLYLGHRWGSHDARVEANEHTRRFQRILRFAEPYIDAHAETQRWQVDRNAGGEIIDLHQPPIRCGTAALAMQEFLEDRRLRKALHWFLSHAGLTFATGYAQSVTGRRPALRARQCRLAGTRRECERRESRRRIGTSNRCPC